MKRALFTSLCGLAVVTAVAGCSLEVNRISAPRPEKTAAAPEVPSGAPSTAPAEDETEDREAADQGTITSTVVCSPLPDAMNRFDDIAGAILADVPPTGDVNRTITDLVDTVVDLCGFQVMADIAYQYPEPVYTGLMRASTAALGEIASLPSGLRCADLDRLGLGPKQAVDYWFFWGAPGLMDADQNGTPCETVWPDAWRYMPSYY